MRSAPGSSSVDRSPGSRCSANAWIERALAELALSHPGLDTVSLAYTLWRETGRALELGNLDLLERMGITALDDQAGTACYQRAVLGLTPRGRLVVTGRLAPQVEPLVHPPAPAERNRYLERPLRWISGVEIVAEARLSLALPQPG